MTEHPIDKYTEGLVEKLQELGLYEGTPHIIIDTYITALEVHGWENEYILMLLKQVLRHFKSGHIKDAIDEYILAIKVNEGH